LDFDGISCSVLCAAFGPMVLLALYWRRVTAMGALAGMVAGAAVSYIWGTVPAIKEAINLYEIVPGVLANFVIAIVVSLLTAKPAPEIDEEFTRMEETVSTK